MVLFYILVNVSYLALQETAGFACLFCIQSAVLSHVMKTSENFTEHL